MIDDDLTDIADAVGVLVPRTAARRRHRPSMRWRRVETGGPRTVKWWHTPPVRTAQKTAS